MPASFIAPSTCPTNCSSITVKGFLIPFPTIPILHKAHFGTMGFDWQKSSS